jgi:hypothetical protein
MKRSKNFQHPASILLTVVIAAVTTSLLISYAQSSNTIQGCFDNKTGVLRKVNAPTDCSQKETAISWNITGPVGPQGDPGPQGVPGTQGPAGAGLPSYDSGWFLVSYNNSFPPPTVLSHNLGTTKLITKVYGARDGTGKDMQEVIISYGINGGDPLGAVVENITPTQLTVSYIGPVLLNNPGGGGEFLQDTYIRVVAVGLP